MKLCFYIWISATLGIYLSAVVIVGAKLFYRDYNSSSGVHLGGPQRKYGLIDGDFKIGALFPIHERPLAFDDNDDPLVCGSIKEIYGIQRVEAAFYAIDLINGNNDILPHIKLGIEIRDECWSAPVAVHQTLKLIYESVADRTSCDYSNVSLCKNITVPLIGVIGPAGSSIAMPVQNLLQLFHIPQIGYSTTSEDFNDNKIYKYFLKLVPSDRYQAQAMIDILLHFNWTYVSAVYTDENYGRSGIKAFKDLAYQRNICIAVEKGISGSAISDYNHVITELYRDEKANVVVCFCEGPVITNLLSAIKRSTDLKKKRLLFIGSDGWAGRNDVIKDFEEYVQGSIMIQIHSPPIKDFYSYYLKLKPKSNDRNPWFEEFWQNQFNCTFHRQKNPNMSVCTGAEELSSRKHIRDPKLTLVVKSVYTYAYALHQMSNDLCGENSYPCKKLLQNFNTTRFREYLINVTFSYQNETVKFNRNGTVPYNSYDILNYQLNNTGEYSYVEIGTWINNNLTIHGNKFQWPGNAKMIDSVCSFPCQSGYEKKIRDKKCCWTCVLCPSDSKSDGNTCTRCQTGFHPNKNKTECKEFKPIYVTWTDTQAIIALLLSTIGIVTSAGVGFVFVIYNNTPVVKSSTKELSYMMLAGMLLAHCFTFIMIDKPTVIACAFSRVLPGFSFALIYGPLLTKTNRIFRILSTTEKKFPKTNMRLLTTKSQVYISSLMIGVEFIICILMLLIEPAGVLLIPQPDQAILTCNTGIRGLVIPLSFNGLLVLMCTTYAFKTRRVPQNFNEAKFIGFSMYATCITWIAFGLIYFGSTLKICIACICISTNALVILIFLFFPKIYIILFKPEKNNRTYFVTTTAIRVHLGKFSSVKTDDDNCEEFLNENTLSHDHSQLPLGYISVNQACDDCKRTRCKSTACQTSPQLIRHPELQMD